ncbi:MAG: DUF4258 domain-containing protein [Candidatus Wallbacteria bacterium]|nr:DUF4258 domain-containing protein [Candidatus Wallbacteria bacterium]
MRRTYQQIKKRVTEEKFNFTVHALERCVERGIQPVEVKEALLHGEIIEDYPHDKYGPSALIFGVTNNRKILHVLCSIDPVWVITAYDPTETELEWDSTYKRRKQ